MQLPDKWAVATKDTLRAKLPPEALLPHGPIVREGELRFYTSASLSLESIHKAISAGFEVSSDAVQVEFKEIVVPQINHQEIIRQLRNNFDEIPVKLFTRIGATLQQLQNDLCYLKPDIALVHCHGEDDGFLIFEDGRGTADPVWPERFCKSIDPAPPLLILSACHSATFAPRERDPQYPTVCISIDAQSRASVVGCVEFECTLCRNLVSGRPLPEAFKAAQFSVEQLPYHNIRADAFRIAPEERSQGFVLQPRRTRIPDFPKLPGATKSQFVPYDEGQFLGRRRELDGLIKSLVPERPGVRTIGGRRSHRIVTLIKEGGIGKTALAVEAVKWLIPRAVFRGGIIELSCENIDSLEILVMELIDLLGAPKVNPTEEPEKQLYEYLKSRFPEDKPGLLFLDNLDDFFDRNISKDSPKAGLRAIIETALTFAPGLTLLATCRWPLELTNEYTLPVEPLTPQEALDIFVAYIDDEQLQMRAEEESKIPNSPVSKIVGLANGHALSIRLLARQMCRPGNSFQLLLSEAQTDLLQALREGSESDTSEKNRRRSARICFELSYRHLSPHARTLFCWLSFLPAGVYECATEPSLTRWNELLGDNWRSVMQSEVDYYALVHYGYSRYENLGGYTMISGVRAYARDCLRAEGIDEFQCAKVLTAHWLKVLEIWDLGLRGYIPVEPNPFTLDGGLQRALEMKRLFEVNEANWLYCFNATVRGDVASAAQLFLFTVHYCWMTGQWISLHKNAKMIVGRLRAEWPGTKVLGECLGTLGAVARQLGNHDEAEEAFHEAANIFESLRTRRSDSVSRHLAIALSNLGAISAEQTLEQRFTYLSEAHRILEGIRRNESDSIATPSSLAAFEKDSADACNTLGAVYLNAAVSNRDAELLNLAADQFQSARVQFEVLDLKCQGAFRKELADTLNNQGAASLQLAEFEDIELSSHHHLVQARDYFSQALELMRSVDKSHPGAFHCEVANCHINFGTATHKLMETDTALQHFEIAVNVLQELVDRFPKFFSRNLAQAWSHLGSLQSRLGNRELAADSFREALQVSLPYQDFLADQITQFDRQLLRFYLSVAPENMEDPWWLLARNIHP